MQKIHWPVGLTQIANVLLTSLAVVCAVNGNTQTLSYEAPRATHLVNAKYPQAMLTQRREGWVTLEFWVYTDGSVGEIKIVDQSINFRGLESAVEAVSESKFMHAVRLDKPGIDLRSNSAPSLNELGFGLNTPGAIKAKHWLKYTFELNGVSGASRRFINRYKNFLASLSSAKKERAYKSLQRLKPEVRNIYEEASYELANFQFLEKWGDELEQYNSIRRAVELGNKSAGKFTADPDKIAKILPPNLQRTVLLRKFALELKYGRLGDALNTAALIDAAVVNIKLEKHQKEKIQETKRKISGIAKSSDEIAVTARLPSSGQDYIQLIRRRFYISSGIEHLERVVVNCGSHTNEYSGPDIGGKLTAPKEDRACGVRILGRSAATITLTYL